MTREQAMPLSDAEVICMWMEPRPKDGSGSKVATPESRWWVYSYEVRVHIFHWKWHPNTLDLDALHEVEAKLSDEQQWAYIEALRGKYNMPTWHFVHASAEQKIKALAITLREEVKKTDMITTARPLLGGL